SWMQIVIITILKPNFLKAKIILFKILIWLLLLIFLAKIIYLLTQKLVVINKKILAIPKYFIILILFLLTLSISVYFAQDRFVAFYGSYNRQQGLASYFFYILFFCLLLFNTKISNTRFNCNKIVITIVLSSFFVSIYGIAQKFGFDFISWTEPAWLTGRVTSSFGQPNYLASYLLLVIPLTLYLICRNAPRRVFAIFFWCLILISQLLCLFFTYSRGGLIGLIVGLIITVLIVKQNIFKKINFKQIIIAFLLFIIFVSIGLVCYYKIDFFRERVRSSFDFQSGSGAIRIKFWKASLSAIKEKPFFGYGLDNQGEVLVKYYQKDWAIYSRVNDYPDRAHNLILDILLTSGIVGLIFYLSWLFVIFKIGIKNIKENKSKFLTIALLASIICYFISLMFNFEIVTTAVYLWLFFALIIIINNQAEIIDKPESLIIAKRGILFRIFKVFLAIILVIVVAGLIFWRINKDIKYLIADHYLQQIRQAFFSKNYFETYVLFGYLQELDVKVNYYDLYYGDMLVNNFGNFDTVTLTRIGKKILEKLVKNLKSNNFETFFIKGKIYTTIADDKDQQYFVLAEENLKQALKTSPEMPKIYQALANLYLKKKDYKLAKDYFNQALNCLPDVNNKYLNTQHRQFIEYEKYNILKGLEGVRN
ncbi:O-antigen ligase family protein, partial [Patescibacteria group bacterium]|nr:O-antigen ligase family protein [Patescibacteria group bacterium]